MVAIDDGAIGLLNRCIVHDNLTEMIENLERDLPMNFFDPVVSDSNECYAGYSNHIDSTSASSNDGSAPVQVKSWIFWEKK